MTKRNCIRLLDSSTPDTGGERPEAGCNAYRAVSDRPKPLERRMTEPVFVQLKGLLTHSNARNERTRLLRRVDEQHIVVDCTKLERIDANGVEVLMELRRSAADEGLSVVLAGADKLRLSMIELHMLSRFWLVPTVDDAASVLNRTPRSLLG